MCRTFCVTLFALLVATAVTAAERPKEMTTRELVAKTRNAIVRINTVALFEQEVKTGTGKDAKVVRSEKRVIESGTGFVVAGGYVVTNNHVVTPDPVPGWKRKRVTFRGTFAFDTRPQRPCPAGRPNPFLAGPAEAPASPDDLTRNMLELKLVNGDVLGDLALLRVDGIAGDFLGERLKHVEGEMERAALAFAPAAEADVGDDVVAIGFARSLAGAPTVTKGIVSALNRGLELDTFTDLVQTDAAINPGNSGGPLLDMRGRVVGVNTYILNNSPGVGFARSARTAEPFVELLKKGPILRPGLGFNSLPVGPEVADLLGLAPGVLLTEIQPGGPAEKAGARPGDLLIRIGSEPVSRFGDMDNAKALVAGRDAVTVTVWRMSEADVKAILADGTTGIDRFKFRRIFQPDGAIKLNTIKKVELTIKLK